MSESSEGVGIGRGGIGGVAVVVAVVDILAGLRIDTTRTL